jgi:probable HAF family extracellular repeat protein
MGEGINESGQAAGVSADNTSHGKAFLWSAGMMTNLGTLGGTFSQANGINASAQVVGYSGTGDRNTPNMSEIIHAFSYKNGIMTDLGAFGGNYSVASAVNDSGLIVGEFGTWDYHTIPAPVHAFSFDGTTMNDLGTLGGLISAASAVNRAGKVVGGAYDSAGNDHAFLYYSTMTDLGTLGGATSSAAGINNLDQIVGDSYTAGGGDHAFLDTGATMLDLNQLLDGSGAGWTLNNAYAINDSGWIVGSGNNGSFLLTPVPEPPSIVLGLIAGVALLAIGRRLVA